MKLSFGAVLRDAAALWNRERDLLLRVAGVFFFLPALGFGLLLTEAPAGEPASPEEIQQQFLTLLQANLPWILGSTLVQEFGLAILFLLFLAPGRPSIHEAMLRALRIFPGFLVTGIICGVIVMTGSLLFILPGLYAQGRTLLCSAAYAANPAKGPIDAVEKGIRLTTGMGWMFFGLWALVFLISYLGSAIVNGLGDPLVAATGGSAFVDMAVRMVEAGVGAGAVLMLGLIRIAAYRRLTA